MRIYIVENGLKNSVGHHANNAIGLKLAVDRLLYESTFLLNKLVEKSIKDDLNGIACFTFTPYDSTSQDPLCGDWESFFYKSNLMAKEFLAAAGKAINESDILFFQTTTPAEVRAVQLILQALPENKRPYCVLNFMLQDFLNENLQFTLRAQIYRFAANELRRVAQDAKLLMTANGLDMASYLTKMMGLNVVRFPLPKMYPDAASAFLLRGSSDLPRIVGVFGDMRNPKGLELLPELIRSNPDISWMIQIPDQNIQKQRGLESTVLEISQNPKVRLFPIGLSSEDYYQMFLQADIILTAYPVARNGLQASGILAEAGSVGKVVVAPKNPWVMEHMTNNRIVGCVYNERTANDIGLAIKEILLQWDYLSSKAELCVGRWREEESIDRYLINALNHFNKHRD